jgi:hypothetical protein
MEQKQKQNLPNAARPSAGPGEHPEKQDHPQHQKRVSNAANPSAGATGEHAECDETKSNPRKQNVHEFDAKASPDSVVQELRKKQVGSNRSGN